MFRGLAKNYLSVVFLTAAHCKYLRRKEIFFCLKGKDINYVYIYIYIQTINVVYYIATTVFFHSFKIFNSINQAADLSDFLTHLFPGTCYCSFHITLKVNFLIGMARKH